MGSPNTHHTLYTSLDKLDKFRGIARRVAQIKEYVSPLEQFPRGQLNPLHSVLEAIGSHVQSKIAQQIPKCVSFIIHNSDPNYREVKISHAIHIMTIHERCNQKLGNQKSSHYWTSIDQQKDADDTYMRRPDDDHNFANITSEMKFRKVILYLYRGTVPKHRSTLYVSALRTISSKRQILYLPTESCRFANPGSTNLLIKMHKQNTIQFFNSSNTTFTLDDEYYILNNIFPPNDVSILISVQSKT
jgi:hypothetical protein